jgi:type VI secretion system protein ImpL
MGSLISQLVSMGLFNVLGIGAVALLIWYTGPYIEILRPWQNRLILIVAVALIYGLFLLIRKLVRRRKEKKMSDDLAASADEEVGLSKDRSNEELATLKDKFDEALQILRKSGKGKYRHSSLYSLPWYMIIGPPGAGKTTLLVNSGLKFPLAEKMGLSKLQGVGGTRFCDWWFTDEAVIVDTAGRYTTQDSDEEVDNAAWMGFLKMLRKNRKRRPINGIIVAVSIDDLSRQSEVDRERAAAAVTQRIQELYEQLRVRFPVYVMFTKCDLMSGFMEFFSDLDRHERTQVWGTTFPVAADPIEQLDTELESLQQQLQVRLVQRLQQERDPQRRNLIYNFPGLFNAARPLVTDFIERVFKPSRYTTTPFIRGVYFTSGTQEGTPFNRLISQLARSFNLSNAAAYSGNLKGKSFFIKDLLSRVIFGESGLAGVNLKAERIYSVLRTAGFVALAVLPLALVGMWWFSYTGNRDMMASLEVDAETLREQIQPVSPQNNSLISVLPVLNEARHLSAGYAIQQQGSVPVTMRFGLYQGSRLARNLTIPTYQRVLENAFLSRLMIRMEQHLAASQNDPQAAYLALKAYLMLGDDERLDPEFLREWIAADWSQSFSGEQELQLLGHLDALLDLRPFETPFALDGNLIETVRGTLAQTTAAQRAYAIIRSELISKGKEFTLAAEAGPDGRLALIRQSGEPFNRGVPAMFSPDGYYLMFIPTQKRVIDEHEEEFWIFGTQAAEPTDTEADSSRLTGQVFRMYFQDYIATWWRFLEDVRIRRFSSFTEAAEILRILTQEDSPLVQLLRSAAKNTKLSPDIPAIGEAETEAISSELNPAVVDREFALLGDFVNGRDGRPSPMDGIKSDLENLYFYFETLARGGGSATAGVQQEMGVAINQVKRSALTAPQPMGEWISELASRSESLVAGRNMQELNARWNSEVFLYCQRAIANRYPFAQNSDSEVALQDFGQFFGPGGKVDQFFNNNLADAVDTNSNPWRVRPSAADSVRISSGTLRQLQLAREIKQAFFSQGGKMPATNFDLKPVNMDPTTTHFTLTVDGQSIDYRHGPLEPSSLIWPRSSAFGQVQIQFSPATSRGGSRTKTGEWAWFRMLDESTLRPGNSPEQFRLTFRLAERWINYELRARSAYNPFNLSQLRSFRCASKL